VIVAVDGDVLAAGLEILPNCKNVNTPTVHVPDNVVDLVEIFTEADHQARFGESVWVELPGVGESLFRPEIVALGLDIAEEARDGLDIVVEDLGIGLHDDVEGFDAAFEIGDQDFDSAFGGKLADVLDEHGEDGGAAVAAVIAVYGGDDSVLELHIADCFCGAEGFLPVDGWGAAVLDITEAAGAGADIAKDQESGGAAAPAFTHVRAHSFFADGVQGLITHEVLDGCEVVTLRGCDPDPFRSAFGGGVYVFGADPVSGWLCWHSFSPVCGGNCN